jgi:hypothetical protein
VTAARVSTESSEDSTSSRAVTVIALGGRRSDDEVSESVEPKSTVEGAVVEECSVDEGVEDFVRRAVGGAETSAFVVEATQSDIASLSSQTQECLCDELSFALFVDVAHNAEKVARVGAVGQGVCRVCRLALTS